MHFRQLVPVLALAPLLAACTAIAGVAGDFGSFVGETSDARCDRRFGASQEKQPFCQEIHSTVASSQFKDDCDNHLQGKSDDGACPADHRLGGCALEKKNDDHSTVVDWYYDVSDLKAQEHFSDTLPKTKDDIRAMCADRGRYEDGAHFVE
jgi:hypothetical protein